MENEIQQIITAAMRYPSGDNCQPFNFEIEGSNMVHIKHIDSRAKHFFNHENFASIIALGSLIELMIIEAKSFGYHIEFLLSQHLGSTVDSNWAQLHFIKRNEIENDNLIGAFEKRWTSRVPFQTTPISREIVEGCHKQSHLASSNVQLEFGKPTDRTFIDYLKQAELFLWRHREAAEDFLKMIRFPGKSSESASDGIQTGELGIKSHEVIFLRLFYLFPALIPVCLRLGMKSLFQQALKRNYLNSSGLVVFAVPSDLNPNLALIHVGRSALRTWLFLNQQGCAVQPMTASSLFCFEHEINRLSSKVAPDFQKLFAQGTSIWRKYFKISTNLHVVWAFRVGYPKEQTPKIKSRRFRLEQLVSKNRL